MAHQPPPTDPFEPHEHPEHGVGHVVHPKVLIATGGALLVLTVVTVAAAKINFEDFDLRELNIFVAMGIALLKATLVCLFFMHLRWDRPFNAFVLVGSLALVALFIAFAMTDTSEYKPEIDALVKTYPEGETPTIKMELDNLKLELDKAQPQTDPAPKGAH